MNDICKVTEFLNRPDFVISRRQEGVLGYVFGCRAGPESNAFNLVHEVAHVIELGASLRRARFADGTLTFKTKHKFLFGRYFYEPTTDSGSRRELRTFVIQYQIMLTSGIANKEDFLEEITPLFSWLPDERNFHKGTFNKTPEFKEFLAHEFDALLPKYPIEKIMKIWRSLKLNP